NFEAVEDIFDLLDSIFDLRIQSFDSDGDGDLNPLFYYMPEDVNIAGEPYGGGLYINGQVDAWGWEGSLALNVASGLFGATDYSGSLALERLDIGGLGWFVLEGVDDTDTADVDESDELNFDFAYTNSALFFNADAALTLFGQQVGEATAKVSFGGIDIDVDIDWFGVLKIEGDLFVGNPKEADEETFEVDSDTGLVEVTQTIASPRIQESQETYLKLDGIDDDVSLGNRPELQITGNQTIELWINPNNLDNRQGIYTKAYGGEGTIVLESNGALSYYYGVTGANSGGLNNTYQRFRTTANAIAIGEWTHIAIVRDFDNGAITWYINGEVASVVDDSTPIFSAAAASDNNAIVGGGFTNNFGGQIDEVRVWNDARTVTEIQGNMNRRVDKGAETNLAYYLPIDESDRSGAGNCVLNERFDGGLPKNTLIVPLTANDIGSVPDRYLQVTTDLLSSQLVGDWNLDGNATNSSDLGTVIDGTYTGNPSTTDALVQDKGSALDFNGSSDGVAIPDNTAINTGSTYTQRTIELWFKADTLEGQQVLYEEGGSANGFNLFLDGGQLNLGAWRGSAGQWLAAPIAVGETYYVVLSFDQGFLTGYLNGEAIGTVATGFSEMGGHSGDVGLGYMNQDTRFFSALNTFVPLSTWTLDGIDSIDSTRGEVIGTPTAVNSLVKNDDGSALQFNGSSDG
ncbi:MAG: LamG-like jellyroll fold domain-containing protein, partial [Prochlorotrichaceae cyanobacterium]